MIRSVLAPNPSPLTLDGTRSYIVGRARVAVVDPGPALDAHLDAVAETAGDGVVIGILLTHAHADHAAGAKPLAERLGAPLRSRVARTLSDGDRVETDAGTIIAVATPGHTPDHFAFHLPAMGAVLCGDLMTGGMDTALVAKPEGDLTAYLESLDRVRALAPEVILPGHGPAFEEPTAALDAYVAHRREREAQVLAALGGGGLGGALGGRPGGAPDGGPGSGPGGGSAPLGIDALAEVVYGAELARALRVVAVGAVEAYLEHLEAAGRVRRVGGWWAITGR